MEDNSEDGTTQRRCTIAMFCGRTSLFILMTGYAVLGALIFKALEGGNESDFREDFQKSREDCLKELWIITERLNVLYEKNWTKLVTEQLKRFERSVVESAKTDGHSNISSPRWTFGGSLLYSLTLLTTVGYGRLSPRTSAGKVMAIVYAIIGVPLMLILLSALGSLLASGARKGYKRLCCKRDAGKSNHKCPSVGYHKAPSSPSGNHYGRTNREDTASIQLSSPHCTPNHVNCKANFYVDHNEVPKRAILATVRSSRTRGKCRQGPVKQMLADQPFPVCSAHNRQGSPLKNSSIVGISTDLEMDDTDDTDDSEHVTCTHDTPSRVPLIWRPPDDHSSSSHTGQTTSVPTFVVVFFFLFYVAAGAVTFASTAGWTFLDATYFCFLALSTIGIGEKLPESAEFHEQMQVFACCLYIFVGLIVVAMCFSLVQEEVTVRCRQIANNMGLTRQ